MAFLRKRKFVQLACIGLSVILLITATINFLCYDTINDKTLEDVVESPFTKIPVIRPLSIPIATPDKSRLVKQRVNFIEAMQKLATPARNHTIIIAYVDSAFMDMAINFYQISIEGNNITNFIFIAADAMCCDSLQEELTGVSCHVQREDQSATNTSKYGDASFIHKMNFRTDAIISALANGFNMLHTDTDVVFLRDPLPEIHAMCFGRQYGLTGCDMAILLDKSHTYNAGFLYVRPTKSSMGIYRRMKEISIQQPTMDDQMQLNNAIIETGIAHRHFRVEPSADNSLRLVTLPTELFASGMVYFERGQRTFAGDNPCKYCIVIHNNWIVSKAAKIYRFREHLMWKRDEDGYFSNTSQKYIEYDNPLTNHLNITSLERNALINALAIGHILDRVVILPRFHCKNSNSRFCALNSFYNIASFDGAFARKYREHVFLQNEKVPTIVRESRSRKLYRIRSSVENLPSTIVEDCVDLVPDDITKRASSTEIRKWFGGRKESILRFHSLYGAFGSFTDKVEDELFKQLINSSLIPANYRQQ